MGALLCGADLWSQAALPFTAVRLALQGTAAGGHTSGIPVAFEQHGTRGRSVQLTLQLQHTFAKTWSWSIGGTEVLYGSCAMITKMFGDPPG